MEEMENFAYPFCLFYREAKNGKKKARIFVNRHSRVLNAKAQTIQGYVTIFDEEEVTDKIISAVDKVFAETKHTT